MFLGRSWFSLQEGATPVPILVERAAEQGYSALTLADKGALYGAPSFVKACRRAGIKPIVGCTLPVAGEPATFLATSAEGYVSLSRLVTRVKTGGLFSGSSPGVVALISRPLQSRILDGICPVYLMLDMRAPEPLNRALAEAGLPVVAVASGDSPPGLDEKGRAFAWCPRAVAASLELEAACADPWPSPDLRLPHFPGDVRALAREGLAARYGTCAPYDQLEKELSVISGRGQAGYFLAICDLVRYAREQGIPVGPGRGSAVGSLTAYALGITAVDPVAHHLYFERFLNPERPDLPDIDLDVCSRGRPRLLEYLRERHGPDRVAHAGVLSTLGARGAVREAGRRLGTPREVVDRVAGALPHHGTIDEAVARLPEFRYIDTAREPIRSLLLVARELEGRPWHPSVHAAGVILSPLPLADLVPLELAAGGEVITQYSSEHLEELGLVKIDILGLRNLTVIAEASTRARLRPEQIPTDDPRTFQLLAEGETIGVFQLDSPGIRNLLRQVGPENMDDLIAVLSLYRPGPFEAGAVDAFTRRRRGLERARYPHPALAPILDETYGVILYQEQAMRIAHEVGGLSLAEADQLRRALAKGTAFAYKDRFVRGAGARGISEETALKIFGLLERFSGYSFNKAHTAAYAQVCYQTAYLKAHHPAAYFAALLAYESGYFGPQVYAQEAQRAGVRLLPPHVNGSGETYAIEGPDAIRTGLLQVKGVGPGAVEAILAGRQAGSFRSVPDFCARVSPRRVRIQAVEALLDAGAFTGLPGAAEGGASRVLLRTWVAEQRPLATLRSRGQLTLFDFGLDAPDTSAQPVLPETEAPPVLDSQPTTPSVGRAPHGSAVRLAGPVITSRRRPVRGGQLGLTMLLQVGPEQVEVLVPPEVYARDLLAIDPAGIAVEGRVQRREAGVFVVAGAIRPAV